MWVGSFWGIFLGDVHTIATGCWSYHPIIYMSIDDWWFYNLDIAVCHKWRWIWWKQYKQHITHSNRSNGQNPTSSSNPILWQILGFQDHRFPAPQTKKNCCRLESYYNGLAFEVVPSDGLNLAHSFFRATYDWWLVVCFSGFTIARKAFLKWDYYVGSMKKSLIGRVNHWLVAKHWVKFGSAKV